jgi:hypothetical protein
MRNRKALIFSVIAMAIIVLFATIEVMAQGSSPPTECTLLFPKGKSQIEITIEPIFSVDGLFPLKITEKTTIEPTPGGGSIDLECIPTYPCIAAPYEISGGKLNVVYLAHDARVVEYYGLRGVGNTSGWQDFAPCDENSFLRSCQDHSYTISAQSDPSSGTQRFVIYYGPGGPADAIGVDVGNVGGGVGSANKLCKLMTPATTDKPTLLTSSTSWKCKNLGNFQTSQGSIVPVTMRYKKEPDGCKVKHENITFYANNPACEVDCSSLPGCVTLPKGQGTKAFRNYCMGTAVGDVGDSCNECMENESGSPQEWWYWNNNQLNYSCFDLANPPSYLCPAACYENAKCPEE